MSGITAGVGIFSGIDTATIIGQLLAIAARPKIFAQARIAQLQLQQGGYLDVSSRLQTLQSAASSLRTLSTFQSMTATSSDPTVVGAVASPGAAAGTYQFIVDRLVSTQQMLSRGFADQSVTGLGATSFTVEGAEARLDRDVALADLNGGLGVSRGKVVITDSAGDSATIDLSKAVTINDVLDAINSSTDIAVTASASGGGLVLKDAAGGGGALTVADGAGYTTATSLGIAGSAAGGTLTGSRVYSLAGTTSLAALNDGNGVSIGTDVGVGRFDFQIKVGGGAAVNVNLGTVWQLSGGELTALESGVSDLAGVVSRINSALSGAGFGQVTASIAPTGDRLRLVDTLGRTIEVIDNSTTTGDTAGDLGLSTTAPVAGGTHTGRALLASLNSTLLSNLLGGVGPLGNGQVSVTLRNGASFNTTLSLTGSVSDMLAQLQAASGTNPDGSSRLKATLNSTGTGLLLTDTTGGTGNLTVLGSQDESDTAAALGFSTGLGGVASSTIKGADLDHRYLTAATELSSLNQGRGVGTGTIRVTDSLGISGTVTIGDDTRTVADLLRALNSSGTRVKARVNDTGDGILLYEDAGGGSLAIKAADESGTTALSLRLAGTAAGPGPQNTINGSFERTISLLATDTLDQVVSKVNAAGAGVVASVLNDGTGSTPYRLNLTSRATGEVGRFVIDTGAFDLGATVLDKGRNAVAFYGSSDPATAILLTGSTNTLDGVVSGVSIDLMAVSSSPVQVTVARDTATIEAKVNEFLAAFNGAIDRIDFQSRYEIETEVRGPLLGDSTLLQLRSELFNTVLGEADNVSGRYQRLTDVGVEIGTGGVLSLDADAFRAALQEDPAAVEALFTAKVAATTNEVEVLPGILVTDPSETFTSIGVGAALEILAARYTNSVDGILTLRNRSLDDQIALQNDRIETIDIQLATKQALLEQQFLAMEQAIAQLQSQQSSLASIQQIG